MNKNLDAARSIVHEIPGAGSGLATAHALIAIAEEIVDLKWAVVRLVEAVKGGLHGGSISVPGATGVPGAPTTVPHQTPAPHGHEDDDGRSS